MGLHGFFGSIVQNFWAVVTPQLYESNVIVVWEHLQIVKILIKFCNKLHKEQQNVT